MLPDTRRAWIAFLLTAIASSFCFISAEAHGQDARPGLMPKWEDLKPQPAKLTDKYAEAKFKTVDLSEYDLPVTVELLPTMKIEQAFSLPQIEITDSDNDGFQMKIELGKPTFHRLLQRAGKAFDSAASMTGKTPQEFLQKKEFFRFENPPTLAISSPDPWGEPDQVFTAWSTRPVGKFDYKMTIGESSFNAPKQDELQLALHIFGSLKPVPGEPKTILEELAVRDVDVEDIDDPTEIYSLKFGVASRFTEAGYEFIAPLTNLESVSHGYTTATDKLLEALQDKQKLARLDVSDGDITDTGLAYLKDKSELTSLDLGGTLITDGGLSHLQDLEKLRTVTLGETQIGDDGLAHLTDLKSIVSLDLHSTHVTDQGLEHLADLENLSLLNLYDNQLTGSGLEHLAGLENLTVINLSNNSSLKPETLAALGPLTRLRHLSLVKTAATPDALTSLNAESVESLELGDTPTTDAQLEQLKRFTKLRSVGLNGCEQIDGSGFAYLGEIPTLESVSLPRTISAEALLKLKDLANIKRVNLESFSTLPPDHSYYQNSDVEALKQARPDLKIW